MRSREACRCDSTQACASSAVLSCDQMCSESAGLDAVAVRVSAVVSIMSVLVALFPIFTDARGKRSAYNTKEMRYLIVLLALGGLIDSVLALRIHMEDPSKAPPCAVTEKWDCGAVNHSRFAVFPAESFDEQPGSKKVHIPVATLGIIGYGLIALAALLDWTWVTLQLAEIGFFCAAMLSYLEAFVIQKWCIYCVWSQVFITAILLCAIVAAVLKYRRAKLRHSPLLAS